MNGACTQAARDKVQQLVPVSTAMHLQGDFFSSWATISFLRRTLAYGFGSSKQFIAGRPSLLLVL